MFKRTSNIVIAASCLAMAVPSAALAHGRDKGDHPHKHHQDRSAHRGHKAEGHSSKHGQGEGNDNRNGNGNGND